MRPANVTMPDHEFCYPHVVPAVAEAQVASSPSGVNARTPLSRPDRVAKGGGAPTTSHEDTVPSARDVAAPRDDA
jgi:hypothetical protein